MKTKRRYDREIDDIARNSSMFDATWYARTYRDVEATGLPPEHHYVRYGQFLNRGVSQLRPSASDCDALRAAINKSIVISFCIPIMNRPDDIRATLRENLNANAEFSDEVEFVVVFFDQDTATQEWIRTEFKYELDSGYLRLVILPPLDTWHFCKAKNAFVGRIRGDIYSSLDGDNVVTAGETRQLLNLAKTYSDILVHHFSGTWGDGTSGRISVSRDVYEFVRYDESLFGRQFDEIDFMISAFAECPGLRYFRYSSDNHAFSTERMMRFLERKSFVPKATILDNVERKSPMNPRGLTYVSESAVISAVHEFNQLYSCWKNAGNRDRARYLAMAVAARHKVIDAFPREMMSPHIIRAVDNATSPSSATLPLFACAKDDDALLLPWYEHYKKMGVGPFYLIDDGSRCPIREVLPYDDVHTFRPSVGAFAPAKGMWIEALIKANTGVGDWVLTVDADEFLDLPSSCADVRQLIALADTLGLDAVPGLLVDLAPGSDMKGLVGHEMRELLSTCDSMATVRSPVPKDYESLPSIAWGFGPYAGLSWKFDLRYHAYGTLDSLRKLPLIRYNPGVHLNQGFHDLHYTNGSSPLGTKIWNSSVILPIRHYKIAKIFEYSAFKSIVEGLDAIGGNYHERTALNISKIFTEGPFAAAERLRPVEKKRYSPEAFEGEVRQSLEMQSRLSTWA